MCKTANTAYTPQPDDHLAVKFRVAERTCAWHHGIFMDDGTVVDHSIDASTVLGVW